MKKRNEVVLLPGKEKGVCLLRYLSKNEICLFCIKYYRIYLSYQLVQHPGFSLLFLKEEKW